MIYTVIKTQILIGFVIIIGVAAVSTGTAFAEEGIKGKAKAISAIVFESGGGKITCPSAGAEIEYTLVKPTKAKEPNWEEQEKTSTGSDLILLSKLSKCESVVPLKGSVTIKECQLHLQGEIEEGGLRAKVTTSVLTECLIKAPLGCEIKIPKGKKVEKINSELVGGKVLPAGKNLKIVSNDKGMTSKVNGACELGGVKSSTEGTLKYEIEAEGLEIK
jgi:hypothetical protein